MRVLLSTALFVSAAAGGTVDFACDVEPLLKRCTGCHGAKVRMNGLRLDERSAALAGDVAGPAGPRLSAHLSPHLGSDFRLTDVEGEVGKMLS